MAPEYLAPGVYVSEVPFAAKPIEGVSTSTAGFAGRASGGPTGRAVDLISFPDYVRVFGLPDPRYELGYAVRAFFANGGGRAWVVSVAADTPLVEGLSELDAVEDLGILCLPGETEVDSLREAIAHAERRGAFLIADPPGDDIEAAAGLAKALAETGSANGAVYYPWLLASGDEGARATAPSGWVAGVYARLERALGHWRAPAGVGAVLLEVDRPAIALSEQEMKALEAAGVNPIRTLPQGPVLWGARTVQGGGDSDSEWKYVSVRRLALYLEHSIDKGTQWTVFEPSGEQLWSRVRAAVDAFMNSLFRAGAFAGQTPRDAYFVRCDRTTMTQADLDEGRLVIVVGVAPVRPAEFVVIRITHLHAPSPSQVEESEESEDGAEH